MNFYIAAKPKNGGRSERVGCDGDYLTLTRLTTFCLFFPTREEAQALADKLGDAPIGNEYTFTVKKN